MSVAIATLAACDRMEAAGDQKRVLLGLAAALRARCDELRGEFDIAVDLDIAPDLGDIPEDVTLCLYRVAQEALNVCRHSHARHARLSLVRKQGRLALAITDDGRGFEWGRAGARRGIGLISLDERVRMLGGRFAVESAPGCGTTISVTVPTGDADAAASAACG